MKEKMNIAIIGAGVVGIASAFDFANAGHVVTVFERNGTACEAASFANGGILSASCTLPLLMPCPVGHQLGKLARLTQQLSTSRWAAPDNLRWLWARSASSPHDTRHHQMQLHQQMAKLGQEIGDAWMVQHNWDVEQSPGHTVLLARESDLQHYALALQCLEGAGGHFRLLDKAELAAVEPALELSVPFHKAIHFQDDRILNCRQFASLVRQAAQRLGVDFHFSQQVTGITPGALPQVRVSDGNVHAFDHVVLCTEALPPSDMLELPAYSATANIASYGLSVGIRDTANAPTSGVQLHQSGYIVTRLGKRLRICGGAELNPAPNARHDDRLVRKMFHALDACFPGAANYAGGTQVWRGSRTFTADGNPLVGPSGAQGVWLNLAHGAGGWTFACASARLLRDQLEGQATGPMHHLISPLRLQSELDAQTTD